MTDDETLIETISAVIPEFEKYFIRPYTLLTKDTLSSSQLKILLQLIHTGEATMSGLAKLLEVSRPQLTSLVDGMVRIGFIERCGGLTDRRVVSVRLTEQARAFYDVTLQRALSYNKSRLDRLSSAEKEELERALLTVRRLLAKTEEHPSDQILP